MNILFVGDIVGENGVDILRKGLFKIKREYNIDACIVNGENANISGTGLTNNDAMDIFSCGADVITGGNHSLRRCDISLYEDNEFILCPANLLSAEMKKGICTLDFGAKQLIIINLLGTAFMENHKNPFFTMDEILKDITCKNILVDFHAESTAEKYALAHYLDGKVSALVGTHTHVQTNDEQILPNGTGYITDVGCVAAKNSVLGIHPNQAINKQKFLSPTKFTVKQGSGTLNAVYIKLNNLGKVEKIEKISYNIDI